MFMSIKFLLVPSKNIICILSCCFQSRKESNLQYLDNLLAELVTGSQVIVLQCR